MKTPIIPLRPSFYSTHGSAEWDLKAICIFAATGFFLDRDTYYHNLKVVPPATDYQVDDTGKLQGEHRYFQWRYTPRDISFAQALGEFSNILEAIMEEQAGDKQVILPISGGLDSRTQAVALKHLEKKVQAFSYEFQGGYPETKIAKAIAEVCDFPFQSYNIDTGYLWESITDLAQMNGCYSEFTHPRQMAVVENFNSLGTVFSLGHWGDVLFDRGIPEEVTTDQFPSYILKKIVKKGGMELAEGLWSTWGIEGTFKAYLFSRVQELWEAIHIENLSARMRAFKSLYWAPRWTSTNLAIFASVHPITVPYYHNKMCEFIGGIPEEFLADRKLQIAYIKERNPKLAKVAWQAHKPFNLYNYHWDKTPWNLPYRVVKKAKREVNRLLGNPLIQRNWELQFKGKTNEQKLESYLFEPSFNQWIPRKMVQDFYDKFQKENPVYYSHAVSMLLTLAIKTQMDGAV